MKFHSIKILIILLSILYKVLAEDENRSDCELALEWVNHDNSRIINDCCVSDDDPFFCNSGNKIESIYLNSQYTDIPNLDLIPQFNDLTSLKIIDTGFPDDRANAYSINTNINKLKKLKTIIVDSINISEFSLEDIDLNCPLEELTLKNTRIIGLSNKLFRLNNLKKLELENNSKMDVKIVKFKNSPIECNFKNTSIDCYQEGACSNISSNDYRECRQYEIYRILRESKNDNQSQSDNKENLNSEKKSNGNKGILIGGLIGIDIIILLILVIIIRKLKKVNKINNYIDFNLYKKKSKVELYEESNSITGETTIMNSHKANTDGININLNPSQTVTEDIPVINNSNLIDVDNSILPSYSQIECSYLVI